jgi:hypothetical protein
MNDLLASFRELNGIEPAIEARLHRAGVYSWEALAEVLAALGDVTESTQRELIDEISARMSEAGDDSVPRPPDGQRSEVFIVRLSLTDDGQPIQCAVTNARTQIEQPWSGWSPEAVVHFIQEQAAIAARPIPVLVPAQGTNARPGPTAGAPGVRDHMEILDAGRAIGGSRRDIDVTVLTERVPDHAEFSYQATLEGRDYGLTSQDWTPLAVHTGHAQPPDSLPLHFQAVELPPGLQRLRVQIAARLATPQHEGPDLRVG